MWTRKYYDMLDAYKFERKALSLVGYYPQKQLKFKILCFFSCCLSIAIGTCQFISMFVQITLDINDLTKVSETLLFFITHSTYMCKAVNFLFNQKNVLLIEDILAQPHFYGFNKECFQLARAKMKVAENVAIIFRCMCVVAVFMYGFMPFLDKSKSDSLPIPGWVPYNYTNHYYPTATFQVIAVCYTAANNVNFDSLFWMLSTLATAQFVVLKKNLKSLDYQQGSAKKVESKFTNYVKHHREIVKYVYVIEMTFSKGIFLTFLSSVAIICFTVFTMVIVPFLGMQFIFLAIYLSCMMVEVAVYCWFGHDVMTTSDGIAQSFYMSNWYKSDMSLRQSISIFLEKTKKPVTLTGGKLVILSLPTFTGILHSSYSYFAVLRQIYTDAS